MIAYWLIPSILFLSLGFWLGRDDGKELPIYDQETEQMIKDAQKGYILFDHGERK